MSSTTKTLVYIQRETLTLAIPSFELTNIDSVNQTLTFSFSGSNSLTLQYSSNDNFFTLRRPFNLSTYKTLAELEKTLSSQNIAYKVIEKFSDVQLTGLAAQREKVLSQTELSEPLSLSFDLQASTFVQTAQNYYLYDFAHQNNLSPNILLTVISRVPANLSSQHKHDNCFCYFFLQDNFTSQIASEYFSITMSHLPSITANTSLAELCHSPDWENIFFNASFDAFQEKLYHENISTIAYFQPSLFQTYRAFLSPATLAQIPASTIDAADELSEPENNFAADIDNDTDFISDAGEVPHEDAENIDTDNSEFQNDDLTEEDDQDDFNDNYQTDSANQTANSDADDIFDDIESDNQPETQTQNNFVVDSEKPVNDKPSNVATSETFAVDNLLNADSTFKMNLVEKMINTFPPEAQNQLRALLNTPDGMDKLFNLAVKDIADTASLENNPDYQASKQNGNAASKVDAKNTTEQEILVTKNDDDSEEDSEIIFEDNYRTNLDDVEDSDNGDDDDAEEETAEDESVDVEDSDEGIDESDDIDFEELEQNQQMENVDKMFFNDLDDDDDDNQNSQTSDNDNQENDNQDNLQNKSENVNNDKIDSSSQSTTDKEQAIKDFRLRRRQAASTEQSTNDFLNNLKFIQKDKKPK